MKEALLHYRKDVPLDEKTFHANEKGVFSRLYDLPHVYKKPAHYKVQNSKFKLQSSNRKVQSPLIIKFKLQTSMFKVQIKRGYAREHNLFLFHCERFADYSAAVVVLFSAIRAFLPVSPRR